MLYTPIKPNTSSEFPSAVMVVRFPSLWDMWKSAGEDKKPMFIAYSMYLFVNKCLRVFGLAITAYSYLLTIPNNRTLKYN